MKQRHHNCQNDRCSICLEDAHLLSERLDKETGDSTKDHLGRYRKWLDDNNIFAETEWGWPSANVYKEENIKAYVKAQQAEDEPMTQRLWGEIVVNVPDHTKNHITLGKIEEYQKNTI